LNPMSFFFGSGCCYFCPIHIPPLSFHYLPFYYHDINLLL
jgi:hypothetical protein